MRAKAAQFVVSIAMALGLTMLGAVPAHADFLTPEDVGGVISRVANEANARGLPAVTVAVVDRMGAVLAVWQSTGNQLIPTSIIDNPNGPIFNHGLNGANLPSGAALAAIAKAVTGAYLSSSGGNAFSTRTASQIVQDHFNPGTRNTSSGPLYGVQFSQLPCSDLMSHFDKNNPTQQPGPNPSPLGLAADPGGFPLYKNGELVGAVGVKAVPSYGLDLNIHVNDESVEETLALAGTIGLSAPGNIVASTITVNGLLLRYTDVTTANFVANPAGAPPFSSIAGGLIDVDGFYQKASGVLTGSQYGAASSGLVPDSFGLINAVQPPLVLVKCATGVCQPRYPVIAGAPGTLSQAEAATILSGAYAVASITRAQIRNPPGSAAKVSISVVDTNGTVLGIVTEPDAPNFGIDVSLQKARTAVFMSSPAAGAILAADTGSLAPDPAPGAYVAAAGAFFNLPVFSMGIAWSNRAIGNVSRDTYPDGIDGTPNGPLGLAAGLTNPFSVGLQLDLVYNNLAGAGQSPNYCTSLAMSGNGVQPVLANGLQIFPGGFPIYRGNQLVGGIGVSGDGVDQDDMIGFLGLYIAGGALGTGIANAPPGIRANLLAAFGVAPRYVNCPFSPFLDGSGDNVCNDK